MKNNNLTYKQATYIVLFGFILISFIIYQKSIKHTLSLSKDCTSLEEQLNGLENVEYKIENLESVLKELEARINSNDFNSRELEHLLLDSLSSITTDYNVYITDFPQVHIANENNIGVHTYEVEIKGSYNNLLSLVDRFEKTISFTKISSLSFESRRNSSAKTNELYAKLILQYFKTNG